MNSDLAFLREIRQKFEDGFENKDPTLVQYGFTMIDDWIDELENTAKEQGVQADAVKRCAGCGLQWSGDSIWCPGCLKDRRTA